MDFISETEIQKATIEVRPNKSFISLENYEMFKAGVDYAQKRMESLMVDFALHFKNNSAYPEQVTLALQEFKKEIIKD